MMWGGIGLHYEYSVLDLRLLSIAVSIFVTIRLKFISTASFGPTLLKF